MIKNDPPPKVPEHFSDEFKDFISLCLQKDPKNRPLPRDLLKHPFAKAYKRVNKEAFVSIIKNQQDLVKASKK